MYCYKFANKLGQDKLVWNATAQTNYIILYQTDYIYLVVKITYANCIYSITFFITSISVNLFNFYDFDLISTCKIFVYYGFSHVLSYCIQWAYWCIISIIKHFYWLSLSCYPSNLWRKCFACILRQQGGIIVAGPGISNISYLHKVFLKCSHILCNI